MFWFFNAYLRECKTLTGEVFEIEATGSTTILEVKTEIAKLKECAPENIR